MVTGLTNGKTYTCTVLATNSVGDGDASVASDATVPATVPGTPAAPTVTRGNASISVAFVAPGSTGGSAITGYTASCTSSDGGAPGSNTGASSPIVVSALTNGKTYTCTVLATNAAGNGSRVGSFGIGDAGDRTERTRGRDIDTRQRADLGRVRRPRRQRERDHRLYRNVHVE